jgi:methylphosphotriester-DNA--protein-cysteine methyltransferase
MWCVKCQIEQVAPRRVEAGYRTCLRCGEADARKVRHTIVPMHKSNYVVVSDMRDLKGINNKGGFYR